VFGGSLCLPFVSFYLFSVAVVATPATAARVSIVVTGLPPLQGQQGQQTFGSYPQLNPQYGGLGGLGHRSQRPGWPRPGDRVHQVHRTGGSAEGSCQRSADLALQGQQGQQTFGSYPQLNPQYGGLGGLGHQGAATHVSFYLFSVAVVATPATAARVSIVVAEASTIVVTVAKKETKGRHNDPPNTYGVAFADDLKKGGLAFFVHFPPATAARVSIVVAEASTIVVTVARGLGGRALVTEASATTMETLAAVAGVATTATEKR
jgi:hypothetical protein